MSELFEAAKVHIDRGQFDEAIQALVDHLNDNFEDEIALFTLGACFIKKGKHGLGAALTRQAIEIRRFRGHNFPEGFKNLGACFRAEGHLKDARKMWETALTIEESPKEKAEILSNLGGSYVNHGTPEKAIEYYDQALSHQPNNLSVKFNRGLALLEQGNWREGWEAYYGGFAGGDRINRHYGNLPEWDGTPGKTLIVWGEQGVGDEIMFASCLRDLIKVSQKVIFDCHPRLVKLFERSFPDVEIHGTRKTLQGLDWVDGAGAEATVCISTLPKWFRNRDEDFPGGSYLKADENPWMPREDFRRKSLRVGVSWAGGTKKTNAVERSIKLKKLLPIFEASPEAQFFSLQYTPESAREVCALEEKTGVHIRHFPSWVQCKDYDRTASFVASMDLVITVCTSIHHLSNALGVPTWTLVPSKPAWRYGAKGHLFYKDSSTFYRQSPEEGWGAVIERVAADLAKFQKWDAS